MVVIGGHYRPSWQADAALSPGLQTLPQLDAILVPVLQALACDQELKLKLHQRDHDLTGNWSGYRECHLKPDLLLVYRKYETEEAQVLYLARLGSHSELF